MYDPTHIASYRRWGARSVGKRVHLLARDGRDAELSGGLSSDPIISSLHRTSANMTSQIFFQNILKWVSKNEELDADFISVEKCDIYVIFIL